jgi:hypothetical protein
MNRTSRITISREIDAKVEAEVRIYHLNDGKAKRVFDMLTEILNLIEVADHCIEPPPLTPLDPNQSPVPMARMLRELVELRRQVGELQASLGQ